MLWKMQKQIFTYLKKSYIQIYLHFFFAGHETTASALSAAMWELSKHAKIQEKIFQEISQHIGKNPPTFEDLKKLEYLDQFISENLRVHPILFIASRVALEDLHYNGQFIPKGSRVGINIYHIHHSSDYWDDPYTFKPERFSPENFAGQAKFSYLPFSLGPRMCLGNHFSLIEQKLFLCRLLQTFEVLPAKSHPLKLDLFDRPRTVWVVLKLRK